MGSEVVFTSNWRVQNSSQLVNNVVLDIIEAPGTTPKLTDRFQNFYFASTICSTAPKKIKIGDIAYICLFPSNISIRRSKSG
jgi:hypothetical protein